MSSAMRRLETTLVDQTLRSEKLTVDQPHFGSKMHFHVLVFEFPCLGRSEASANLDMIEG